MTAVVFSTPKSTRQSMDIVTSLRGMEPAYGRPNFRYFVRKVGKALDDSCSQIATLTPERNQIDAALECQKPHLRRRVRLTAQQRFVRMPDLRKVKRSVGLLPDNSSDETA